MMRSRWTGSCGVAFGLAGFVAVGVAAGPPAHPPNATTDVAATQAVRSSGSGPCPPIVPPASAASNTAGMANAPPASYGDAHYAAARIAADVERMRQRLSCAPPVGDAYGARDAWDRVDEAAGDASNAEATSTTPTTHAPPPAKPGSRERRRAQKNRGQSRLSNP
jgi:hypothetical protein